MPPAQRPAQPPPSPPTRMRRRRPPRRTTPPTRTGHSSSSRSTAAAARAPPDRASPPSREHSRPPPQVAKVNPSLLLSLPPESPPGRQGSKPTRLRAHPKRLLARSRTPLHEQWSCLVPGAIRTLSSPCPKARVLLTMLSSRSQTVIASGMPRLRPASPRPRPAGDTTGGWDPPTPTHTAAKRVRHDDFYTHLP
jgi:hypothetical protein